MKKLGIILDSSSGLSKNEAINRGFLYIPIVIDFNGQEYLSGVDIDNDYLYKNMNKHTKIRTAASKSSVISEIFKTASKEYEQVLYLSLSKNLSSLNSNAKKIAAEISDKIHVYDSKFITPWILKSLPKLEEMIKKGSNVVEVINFLDQINDRMIAYIIPGTLEFLRSGGRISKTQYIAGSWLKIFPIIKISNGSLNGDKILKGRTISRTISKMIDLILEDKKHLEEKGIKNLEFEVININSDENFKILLDKLEEKGIDSKKIKKTKLTSEIVAHLGPNVISVLLT